MSKSRFEKAKDALYTVVGIMVFPPLGLQYIYLTGKCDANKEAMEEIHEIFDREIERTKKAVEIYKESE